MTTKGWYFLVQWCDGQESWVPLKELKESNPVELAEYAHSRGLQNEPAMAWWVPYALKKKNRIIAPR